MPLLSGQLGEARVFAPTTRVIRFGAFEMDVESAELRKAGRRVPLQEQPFRVLVRLVGEPGRVVTREELRRELWPADTFVDFEQGLNAAVRRLRDALGDSAENPRFVETVPRRGYRFLAPVQTLGVDTITGSAAQIAARRRRYAVQGALAVLLLGVLPLALNLGALRDRLFPSADPPVEIESIAVLPLKNLTGDPDQEYFVEGMHEALTTELTKISALKVISRSSTIRYKHTEKPLAQIARELGVTGLIDGSVLREGDSVRIAVQLIHAPSDRHLWADSFDRELPGILALHSEVARAIARQIRISVLLTDERRLAGARPVSPEAYEAYLKGRHLWEKRTRDGLERALKYFNTATDIDPEFALGYAGLADTYLIMGNNRFLAPRESYPTALAAARKALELDEELAEAHATIATGLAEYAWDWLGAEREFNRALELNPGYAPAHHYRALFLSAIGRHNEALMAIRKARSLDPLSPRISANVGLILYFARQHEQAIQELQNSLQLFPDDAAAHLWLGQSFSQLGLHGEALEKVRQGVTLLPDNTGPSLILAHVYARAGKPDEARRMISSVSRTGTPHHVDPALLAMAHASIGDKNRAFAWLEKGYAERSVEMTYLATEPFWDPLRDDRRFEDLLRRVNLPPQHARIAPTLMPAR